MAQRFDSAEVALRGRWQLFPPLSAEEARRLEEDVRQHGVLLPVEVDRATGLILDGHHRKAIADRLGIACETTYRDFETDEERIAFVISVNLKRRHLDPVSWGEFFDKLCTVEYKQEIDKAAANSTAASAISKEEIDRRVAASLGVKYETAKKRRQAARLPEALKEAVQANKMTVSGALMEQRRQGAAHAGGRGAGAPRREVPRPLR